MHAASHKTMAFKGSGALPRYLAPTLSSAAKMAAKGLVPHSQKP